MEAVVRLGVALSGIVLVAVAGGCTSHSDENPSWNGASPTAASSATVQAVPANKAPAYAEPFQYSYTLTRGCNAKKPLGRYNVVVKSGDVVSTKRLGATVQASPSTEVDLGPAAGQDGEEIDVPSLAQLITMARTAVDDGAEVQASYDAKNGRPVKVVIKSDKDDVECFAVSDYDIWNS